MSRDSGRSSVWRFGPFSKLYVSCCALPGLYFAVETYVAMPSSPVARFNLILFGFSLGSALIGGVLRVLIGRRLTVGRGPATAVAIVGGLATGFFCFWALEILWLLAACVIGRDCP